MQAHKEWNFVDTFTEAEQERYRPHPQKLLFCAPDSNELAVIIQASTTHVLSHVHAHSSKYVQLQEHRQCFCFGAGYTCTLILSCAWEGMA